MLRTEIQRGTRKGGYISAKTLKDAWKEAPTAIEEFEKAGEVLATRTLKDGQMRHVFWNDLLETDPEQRREGPNNTGLAVEKGACSSASEIGAS
jgi:hypothetical protein